MDIRSAIGSQIPTQHADAITASTPTGSIHPAQALNANGEAMRAVIGRHLDVHRPNSRSPGTAEQHQRRNDELNAIRDDRALKLQREGFTPERLDKAEKNAAKLDTWVLTNLKAGMAGSPFAGLTLVGNLNPEVLKYNPQNTPLKEIGKQSAFGSLYASGANLTGNKLMNALKPRENLNPPDHDLHAALQASRLEKRELHDKGLLRSALDEAGKWATAFAVRNFVLNYPLRVLLERAGKAELAIEIENILRPLTALVAGICVEQFNQYRDRHRDIAGPAMLYGRRDRVPEGEDSKPIADDHEWLDNLQNLEKADWLFSKATGKEFTDRVGKGAAGAASAVFSGEALKVIGEPENILSEGTLAAGFAAYGVLPTALRALLDSKGYKPAEATAIADALKEFLGMFAFASEAFMGVMGKGGSENAIKAVNKDDQFAKGVTKGLDAGADLTGRAASKTSGGIGKAAMATGNGIANGGRYIGHGLTTGAEYLGSFASQQGRSLVNHAQRLTQRTTPATGTSAPAAATAIPMAAPAPNQRRDENDIV